MTRVKRYVAECFGGGEFADRPVLAVFDIDQTLAQRIVKMAEFVKRNSFYKVEDWKCSATWLENFPMDGDIENITWTDEDGMWSECDRLAVTADTFLFLCYRKNGSEEFEAAEQSVAELAHYFGIPFGAPLMPPESTAGPSSNTLEDMAAPA